MSRTNRVVVLLTDEELASLEESIEIDAKEKGARRTPATNVAVRDLIYEFVDQVQEKKKTPDLFRQDTAARQ